MFVPECLPFPAPEPQSLIHGWELSQIIDIWQQKWGLGRDEEMERIVNANEDTREEVWNEWEVERMNEQMEKAQDADTGEEREGAQVARPSLAEARFRKDSEGRTGCDLFSGMSFKTRPARKLRSSHSELETKQL